MVKQKIYTLLILVFILSGCASGPREDNNFYWPSPPEEPKISYIGAYRGEADFREASFLDVIFGTSPDYGLPKPYGVFSKGDKIYVTLTQNPAVAVIDKKARTVKFIGDAGAGRLSLPLGVAISNDGMAFVSDARIKKVYGYDENGGLRVAIGTKNEFQNPSGIAINQELGRLYVVDSKAHNVHVYTLKGEPLFKFGERGDKDGQFNFPSNVAIDRRNGNVYIVDTQNFRVQYFDKDGQFISKFGNVGDVPGSFTRPKGIGVDSDGHVYVADAAFDNFQIFDDKGQLLLYVGSGGTGPGQFQLPAGLYIDEQDRIFVADSVNFRVQAFQYLSDTWKKDNPEQYKKFLLK